MDDPTIYPEFSPQEYSDALLKVRDKGISGSHTYIAMLRFQGNSENHTSTSTRMANELGYENYNAANLHYGTYASLVANELGFHPQQRADGTLMWWTTFSSGKSATDDTIDGHFEFVMHPTLVTALSNMNWIKRNPNTEDT